MIIEIKGDVLKLKSSLVENQWPAIKSAVKLLLKDHPTGIIIDCTGLTEVSEQGAKTFLDASSFIQAFNARVVISNMPEDMLAEIKKFPGVRSQLVIASSVEEARASLQCAGQTVCADRRGPVILIPLIGLWRQTLNYAVIHARERKAEIHLLYIMTIPRNLPIGVPSPEIEGEADSALREAEQLLRKSNTRIVRLTTRARDLIEGATKYAVESKPDMIVVGYQKSDLTKEGGRCPVISTLCHEVSCDIALYCISE